MGADIHCFIEYKEGDLPWRLAPGHKLVQDETWDDKPRYTQVSAVGRNYTLFGMLANVRSEGPDAKDFPKDCNPETVEAVMYSADHSYSWETLEDFENILKDYNAIQKASGYHGYNMNDASCDAFNEQDLPYDKRPQDYVTMINYCKKLKADLEAESLLLSDNPVEVRVRIVFGFDS